MALPLPIARRATKCLVPGATAIYLLNEGAGQVLNDASGHTYDGMRGDDTGAGGDTDDPTWTAYGLDFDGATDYCLLPDLPPTSAFQVVFQTDAALTPTSTLGYLLGFVGTATYHGIQIGNAATPITNEVLTVRAGGTQAASFADAAASIPAGWHVLTFSFSGGAWSISLDGAHLPVSTYGTQTATATQTTVTLGAKAGGNDKFNGGMGAFIARPSGLTADQVDSDERTLAAIMAARGATITLTQTPIVLFEFDDGLASIYDNAYPALTAAGVKATAYVITDRIDDPVEGAMSTAELAALYAAGWDIGGHGYTHDISLAGATEAAQTTEIGDCRDDLLTRGFTRSAYHYNYRGGAYDATTLTVMAALGMKTGRTISSTTTNRFNPVFYEMKGCKSLDQNLTLAAAEAHVDALVPGQICQFYGHLIDDSAAELSWTAADLGALATYVRSKGITPLTISELYTLLGGT